MKKKLNSILALVIINTAFSQVGINMSQPSATLDILSKGTNATTKAIKISNSENPSKEILTILDNGNMGINNINPQTKIAINSPVVGSGFNLTDGSQGNGKVLTSDTNGNAMWKTPGFGQFKTISGGWYSQQFQGSSISILKDQNGQPVFLEVDDFGNYNFSIGFHVSIPNLPSENTFKYVIIQLLPDDGTGGIAWGVPNNRFPGSYEVYGIQGEIPNNRRVYYSQNLTITPATGKRLYVWISLASDSPDPLNALIGFGQNNPTGCPQCTGGSYVRIN